jgi:tetratricopeptide (TPR) repeat protein
MNQSFTSLLHNKKAHLLLLSLISILLYINTMGNGFVLDDFIVVKNNTFTTKGVKGIPDILRYDTFRGFLKSEQSGSAVTGGRYRPMTLVFFSFIWQIFGDNPAAFHLFNILFFTLLCLVIYMVLERLLRIRWPDAARPVAFLSSLLFALHPIHTEVVANIKGLDEIFSLLFSLIAFQMILLSSDTGKRHYYWIAGILFTLAMFSKENAIHFVALIPLALLMLRSESLIQSAKAAIPLLSGFAVYMAARVAVIGFTIFDPPLKDLMVNPFLKYRGVELVDASTSEKLGMIFYSLLKYLGLLIFPHPLTHDYFPKQIPLVRLATPVPFLSLLAYGLIVFFIIRLWKRNPISSYALLSYLIPTLLISNLIFNIGTPMGERFIFVSSLGFCMLLAYGLYAAFHRPKLVWPAGIGLGLMGMLFSYKTITRNLDWKDNYRLFSTDIKVSRNSAKAHSSLGFDRMSKFRETRDTALASKILDEGILHLEKTVSINPREISCYHYLGNSYYMKKNYLKAAEYFDKYLSYDPNNYDVIKNLATAYREEGRNLALKKQDLENSLDLLMKSLKINANDARTVESIGIAYGAMDKYEESLNYLHKASDMSPRDAFIIVNLANTYYKKGDRMTATEYMKKAYQVDPNLGNKLSQTQKDFF